MIQHFDVSIQKILEAFLVGKTLLQSGFFGEEDEESKNLRYPGKKITGVMLQVTIEDEIGMFLQFEGENHVYTDQEHCFYYYEDLILKEEIDSDYHGCGDHNCYVEKPKGMATNGGCRCHQGEGRAKQAIIKLAKEVESLKRK